jgi:serine/threonine protein kinase
VGTADYLSPEQIRTPDRITRASDIYSLGCTLYYAVTGKVPYPGGTPKSKARRHMEETPWHPRRFNEEVSDEFVDLIGDMMEKDPALRIQSAQEVADRLAPWASDNSPLLAEHLERSRWHPAPLPKPAGEQDTDPADEIADMAMTEISGNSETSHGSGSSEFGTRAAAAGRAATPPPPPFNQSLVSKYKNAGHLKSGEPTFSMNALVMISAICLVAGVIVGYLTGKVL